MDRVYTHKFLGFIIDPTLKWDSHVKAASTQIAKSAGIISKARKYLNKETLLMLYYAFIYPHIDYGILIWGASFQESLYPIVAMQKRIIRIITFAHKRDHTCNLFKNTGILTIHSSINRGWHYLYIIVSEAFILLVLTIYLYLWV